MRHTILSRVAWAGCPPPRWARGRCCANMGGLVIMTSIPAEKACVNNACVMALVSMGRRVSHPRVAFGRRRSGYRLCSRVSFCVVASCASGSIFDDVYDATAWPDFKNTSSIVAIPPQIYNRCSVLSGRKNNVVFASESYFCGCRAPFL